MFAKLKNPGFLAEMRPLLSAEQAEQLTDDAIKTAFAEVFHRLVVRLPGDPWALTEAMKERYGMPRMS
ncbi:hypothetical protein IV102_31555 [bacterium]|nr:hypothetical protein [bacterium]